MSNYLKYRGKCRELCEQACFDDPSLKLVRGYYICPTWGKQAHWWTVRPNGMINDPTRLQFPSEGFGEYVEFDGVVECANCGAEVKEEDATIYGNYAFCSGSCICHYVGVG